MRAKLYLYTDFRRTVYVLKALGVLMQDSSVSHLDVVLPGPGLPARDEPLQGEHQLRELRDLSPLEKWQICVK